MCIRDRYQRRVIDMRQKGNNYLVGNKAQGEQNQGALSHRQPRDNQSKGKKIVQSALVGKSNMAQKAKALIQNNVKIKMTQQEGAGHRVEGEGNEENQFQKTNLKQGSSQMGTRGAR
eukprot:TRINITY_DN6106_c0_g1_i1.p3 TRINITY_DN6106_c0_g1~~TRINITY_DN6106_c0_g1_i1.p3  ORF type:complete len:117 (+),score=37.66 TRINITY_DN6106_c0_g1_i1:64-414(+)